MVFAVASFVDCSPRKTVEIEVYCVIMSVWVLGVVANIDGTVWVIMSIPKSVLQESSGDVVFSPSFQDNICFI